MCKLFHGLCIDGPRVGQFMTEQRPYINIIKMQPLPQHFSLREAVTTKVQPIITYYHRVGFVCPISGRELNIWSVVHKEYFDLHDCEKLFLLASKGGTKA